MMWLYLVENSTSSIVIAGAALMCFVLPWGLVIHQASTSILHHERHMMKNVTRSLFNQYYFEPLLTMGYIANTDSDVADFWPVALVKICVYFQSNR